MIIRNRKSGKQFTPTKADWENLIVAKGYADMYEIIEDDAPLEVKKLRDVVEIKKKQSKAEETKPEVNKANG
jgi:hypothetical protein